jgi:hypothetical protein
MNPPAPARTCPDETANMARLPHAVPAAFLLLPFGGICREYTSIPGNIEAAKSFEMK